MTLETVVHPQDPFGYGCKDLYTLVGYDFALPEDFDYDHKSIFGVFDSNGINDPSLRPNWDSSSSSVMHNVMEQSQNSSPEPCTGADHHHQEQFQRGSTPPEATSGRRKRRRTRSCKNKEELENQRMTHIAVERNRRKQMNDYLAVIRSLMPASYVQRGDQASTIGGAINFVKELEQLLQTLEAHKRSKQHPDNGTFSPLFSNFFTFPKYSTATTSAHEGNGTSPAASENRSALGDVEVTVAESHANLKILSKRRPRQLLNMVAGLQGLRLTVLHLNVTTVDQMVLYSLSVKIEHGCQLTTVDEIANAVNNLLAKIEEEAFLS